MKNTYFHAPLPYIPNFHFTRYIPFYLGCNSLDNIFAASFSTFFHCSFMLYTLPLPKK